MCGPQTWDAFPHPDTRSHGWRAEVPSVLVVRPVYPFPILVLCWDPLHRQLPHVHAFTGGSALL